MDSNMMQVNGVPRPGAGVMKGGGAVLLLRHYFLLAAMWVSGFVIGFSVGDELACWLLP